MQVSLLLIQNSFLGFFSGEIQEARTEVIGKTLLAFSAPNFVYVFAYKESNY